MTRRVGVAAIFVALGLGGLAAQRSATTARPAEAGGSLPERPQLTEIGAAEGGLPVISDLAVFDNRLWLVESRVPLAVNGASIWTYEPSEGFVRVLDDPFSQGFLRGDVIDGKLYVADGDPRGYAPGIVHVFDNASTPPRTTIVDEAIHNFQVIKFGGDIYVSGGLADASSALNRYDAATGHWTVAERGRVHMRLKYLAVFDEALYGAIFAQNDAELVKIDRALDERDISLVTGAGITLDVEVQRNRLYATGISPTGPYAFRIEAGSDTPVALQGLTGAAVFDFAEHDGVIYAVGCDKAKSYSFGSVDGRAFTRLLEWNDLRFGFAPGANGSTNADGRPSLASFQGKLYLGSSTTGRLYRLDEAVRASQNQARSTRPKNWPSFRGEGGSGNGDGQRAVTDWDVTSGKNIKWKTPIPGIAHSSPIVWGNRIFVTTAIGKGGDGTVRTGLFGDVTPVDDLSDQEWKIYALDKASGRIVWERTAFAGAPKTKRHPKASQANSTPVTDGRRVVAAFGSIGLLVAWDLNGKELWRADLGILDSGWRSDPSAQWGHASSPITYRNSVILQADMQKGSYIAAWDLETGTQLWKTIRGDEVPTWGTPAVVSTPAGRDELVTNGTRIRGYDPATGTLRWTLGPNSDITVGSPVSGNGLVFVTGGYPPVRPIYAIRPGATGDISLANGAASSSAIAWSNMTDGTYIPTPVVYEGYLYTFDNNGILAAYNASTGQRAFRGRVGSGGAFSASPVAADGFLYLASEDGEIYVVTTSPGFALVAKNDMKEVIMATPAISNGLIVVRTLAHLYGIGQ